VKHFVWCDKKTVGRIPDGGSQPWVVSIAHNQQSNATILNAHFCLEKKYRKLSV
jgi:hypothetical protein